MKKLMITTLITLCFTVACTKKQTDEEHKRYVMVEDGRFVTPEKQELYLKAINVVNKNESDNFVPRHNANVYKTIKEHGFNCIRLGVNWAALEPYPLTYSEVYISRLDEQIELIKQQGLYIVLDMHQDLFSIKYGNGAPAWATLDQGKEHTRGEVWSDAYYMSDAVKTSFDNFWDNKTVESTSIGLQEHYARLWQVLAKRYANESHIVGYDLMNEPFAGSIGPIAMHTMFAKMAEIDGHTTAEQLQAEFASTEGKGRILDKLYDIEIYRQIMQAPEVIYQEFEKNKLQTFYQRLADSIRSVDQNHILFLEPSVSMNNGVLSAIEPTTLSNGKHDGQIAFAPHLYDIVMDTDLASTASEARLSFILAQIRKSADRFNLPVFVGEWGAFYNNENCSPVAHHYTQMFDLSAISNAYWDYTSDIWQLPHFTGAMQTICPQKVNGKLLSVRNSSQESVIKWKANKENSTNESIIYIPQTGKVLSAQINVKGTALVKNYEGNATNGYLIVNTEPVEGEIELVIKIQK